MKKGIIRKIECCILCMVLAVSMMIKIPAHNVRAMEKDFCYIGLETLNPPEDFPEEGYIYYYRHNAYNEETNEHYNEEKINSYAGAAYDVKTNTLTLNNFNKPDIGLILDGMGKEQNGTDLKIVVIGNNSVQKIWSGHDGFSIEGTGTLLINENRKADKCAIMYGKGYGDTAQVKMHIGKDVTVIAYKSSEDKEDLTEATITISNLGKEDEKISDFLSYDGIVSPELKFEKNMTYEGYIGNVSLANDLFVKNDYNIDRLYNDKDNANYIRILLEGQVSDTNETYGWLEKHNGKWYVSRTALYDTGINGAYTGTVPQDLKNGDNKISAYEYASSTKAPYDNMYDNFVVYTKGDKYYTIAPECMLVDELSNENASSDVYYMGEIIHNSPVFYFDYENDEEYNINPYDTWIMDSYTKADGVSTWKEAGEYMISNGYTKLQVQLQPPEYELNEINDKITFSPKAKSAANIKVSAESFDKTEGDAAFSLGATTDAGAKLSYASDNEAVAKVDANGNVSVIGAGTAKITITASGDDYTTATKVVTVTVNAKPSVNKGEKVTDEKTGATYKVTESTDGKVEVEYKASSSSKDKKVTVPSKVVVNGVEATVTSIADNAFANNKKVTSVKLPDTVTDIGDGSFKNCTKLTEINIPKNVEEVGKNAFAGCTSLKKANFKGTKVKKIDQGAFKNCKKLSKMTIPKSVTTIGKEAFSGDKKLKNMDVKSANIKSTGKKAFNGVPSNAVIKVPKKQKKTYAKMFKKAGFKGKVK